MAAGSTISRLNPTSLIHTWASFAASTVRERTGSAAMNAASRPKYRELMIKKKLMISVPIMERATAMESSISGIPIWMSTSSMVFSMKYRNTPR